MAITGNTVSAKKRPPPKKQAKEKPVASTRQA
jgi:hypothetical protein